MAKSIHASTAVKPYPEFPLTPHPTGRWCKKVRGKLHYFGPIGDPEAALKKWEAERDYLLTGRTPPPVAGGVTVGDVCNAFLTFKQGRVTTGELSPRTWKEYKVITDGIVATFGKGRLAIDLDSNDFGRLRDYLAKGRGLVSLTGLVRKSKIVFKWGFDSGLLERPPRYGQSFAAPSRSALRKEKAVKGRQDFTADEIKAMLAHAKGQVKAFVLLGINCGFGSGDIGKMPATALDLEGGWATYPRPKTGVARRCRLWPETVEACKAAKPNKAKDNAAGLAWVTKYGNGWNRYGEAPIDAVAQEFRKLCKAAGIERNDRGFYGLRRTLATVADGARDPVALRHIMGHAAPSNDMGDVYRQSIGDDRLEAVTAFVRSWLWPKKQAVRKVKAKA